MSKKLDSILSKIPSATVNKLSVIIEEESKAKVKMVRLNADVPYDLKIQMKKYQLEHPGETDKSIIIRGLIALGFQVDKEYLIDLRTKRNQ